MVSFLAAANGYFVGAINRVGRGKPWNIGEFYGKIFAQASRDKDEVLVADLDLDRSACDFETGTRAAAFGGTTTLIDFAIQYKGQTLRTAFDTWMQKASGKAVCDYAFYCIITKPSSSGPSTLSPNVVSHNLAA